MSYVEPAKPRHRIAILDGREEIQVPPRRNWFFLPFMCLWLVAWTGGGVMAVWMLVQTREPFVVLWLCMWAFGWVFAFLTVAWQITGGERLRVIDGDLEIVHRLFRRERRRRCRGSEIRNLAPQNRDWMSMLYGSDFYLPLFASRSGSARFDYGARTIYFANGVDAAEGAAIVEWLRARLGEPGKLALSQL